MRFMKDLKMLKKAVAMVVVAGVTTSMILAPILTEEGDVVSYEVEKSAETAVVSETEWKNPEKMPDYGWEMLF